MKDARVLQPSRHLLYLIDGTGLNAGKLHALESYSNIYNINIFTETHSVSDEAIIGFYFSGVASSTSDGVGQKLAGIGLADLIEQVYINICSNFNAGDSISVADEIYLFGFSRGAFAVQVICRLMSEYGLLHASKIKLFNDMYRNWLGQQPLDVEAFRNENCRKNVRVAFAGLFDSVFGIYKEDNDGYFLKPVMDKNPQLPSTVNLGVHLLSIDEQRRAFKPYPWRGIARSDQKLIQIWMPGNHTDVGGGYPEDLMGAISLDRMLKILAANTSLKLDEIRVADLNNKITQELGQDQKRYVHAEKIFSLDKIFNLGQNRNLPELYRAEFVTSEHFLDDRARFFDRKFVVKEGRRVQYTVPKECTTLTVFDDSKTGFETK
jgi:Uncharacterized alpha/beta hydrolase domain (DUF2235)